MRHLIVVLALLGTCFLFAPTAYADDTARGVGQAAFDRGDWDAALKAWTPLLPQRDAHIQFSAGRILLVLGGETEIARGMKLIRSSARAGHIPALEFMAQSKLLGMYTPQDIEGCVRYLRDVERAPHSKRKRHAPEAARALLLLNNFYKFGTETLPRDRWRSVALLKQAAEMGDPTAQFYYGMWMGLDVKSMSKTPDRVESHKWFVLSWKQDGGIWRAGDLKKPKRWLPARSAALMVREKMSKEEFERSKARIRAWMEKKARGEVGWAFDADRKLSRGARTLQDLEEAHRDIGAGMSSMDLEFQMPCVPVSSKAKHVCVQGHVAWRSKQRPKERSGIVEHWTYVSGETKRVYPVVFTRTSSGMRWRIDSPIPGS